MRLEAGADGGAAVFRGSSALALAAAAGSWPPEDSSVAELAVVTELEEPASAEPVTLEDESEP